MAKISSFKPLPIAEFDGDIIKNGYIVAERENRSVTINLQEVFDWIKEESIKNGLTVELKNNQIMFITGNKTDEL